MSGVYCRPEIHQIILMVSLIGIGSDRRRRSWRQVVGIGGGLVVLERFVVSAIVSGRAGAICTAGSAHCLSSGYCSRTKTTLEPAPRDSRIAQQISDVLPLHRDSRACAAIIV